MCPFIEVYYVHFEYIIYICTRCIIVIVEIRICKITVTYLYKREYFFLIYREKTKSLRYQHDLIFKIHFTNYIREWWKLKVYRIPTPEIRDRVSTSRTDKSEWKSHLKITVVGLRYLRWCELQSRLSSYIYTSLFNH